MAAAVIDSHPRIWWTAARLARWRNYWNRPTARAQTVKARADAIVNSGLAAYTYFYSDLLPLAVAYQVTGDTAYADRGIAILLQSTDCCATPPQNNWWTRDQYFDFRDHVPAIALAYDWFFDRLTTAQKQTVATLLMDRADDVWPDTNPARVGGFGVEDPSSNYFYGFLMTWPAALAVYGDGMDTGVGGVSGSDRPAYHYALGRDTKWPGYAKYFVEHWGVGGGFFAEDTNYGSQQRLAQILDAHFTATGEDLVNAEAWSAASILFKIYLTTPDKLKRWAFGSQPNSSIGNMNLYDRQRVFILGSLVTDSTKRAQAKWWLDHVTPSDSGSGQGFAEEFLYYDEDAISSDYSVLPLSYFASGPGLLVKRSGWGTNDKMWTIWAGPLANTHQLRDCCGFEIWAGGGYIFGSAQSYSQAGTYEDSIYQNIYTIGDAEGATVMGQSIASTVPGAVIHQEVDTVKDYALFEGQGKGPYNFAGSGRTDLSDFVRKFVAVGGDSVYFIYDRVSKVSASWHTRLCLQSQNAFTVTPPAFSVANAGIRADCRTLLPASVVMSTGVWNLGPGGAVSSHLMSIRPPANSTTDYFLHVLQLAAVGAPAAPTPLLITSGSVLQGASNGTWCVLFGKSEAVSVPFAYTVVDAAREHVITDLTPGLVLTASASSNGGQGTTSVQATVSAAGVLRFTLPWGNATITVDTTAPVAVGFTLSGPAGGPIGVDSGLFSVTPDNPVPVDTVVTITSNGGGGAYFGNLAFRAGETAARKFRWRPDVAGSWTLTATPSPALGTPATAGYVASGAVGSRRTHRGTR